MRALVRYFEFRFQGVARVTCAPAGRDDLIAIGGPERQIDLTHLATSILDESFAVKFSGPKWTTERILARIKGRRIKSLDLYNTCADDDLLIALSESGSLVSLELSSGMITDAGVGAIVRKCGLRSLMFRECPLVSDRCMADISTCMTLRELYLDATAVTDDGVPHVAALPHLWSLVIDRTQITDEGIRRIASERIGLISFNDTAITGAGFSTWLMKDKMAFYTKNSLLNDEGFSTACKAFPWMWNLVIENTNVTTSGLYALAGQSPSMIRIRGSKIDREGVLWLIENTEVQGLEVDPTQFSEEDAERYRNYKGRYLRISVY